MKILVEIDTDNAAFRDAPHLEIQRILNSAAHLAGGPYSNIHVEWECKLQDANGNTVGFIKAVHHSEETL